jgi:hypothetical protein
MKDFLSEIYTDTILSYLTKKYGSKLNDNDRINKCSEIIYNLKDKCSFSVGSIQNLIDRKGLNSFCTDTINGQSVYRLSKLGLFGKPKICYFITRIKDEVTSDYLDKVYEELRSQTQGNNVFNSPDYKN